MKADTILVFDFGGQYCHLIARRIRDRKVYSEIVPSDISLGEFKELILKFNVKGIILSGGPSSIYEKGAPRMDEKIINYGMPVMGICYGHQLLAHDLGGNVVKAEKKEFGASYAFIEKPVGILEGLGKKEEIWMSHGDTVLKLPEDFENLAYTENCPIASFKHKAKPIFGIQWHPEVLHTKNGDKILDNFIFKICKCEPNWDAERTVTKYVDEIKDAIGKDNAMIALSGGVDSSTAAALASKALGKRLTAVFVDTGLMRENEPAQIKEMAEKLGINLLQIDAGRDFLSKLNGVTDPEEKRKIVGREFIRVFEDVAKDINASYLIQGTIYPDRIESGHSKNSKVIKTHHNVGGLPEKVKFKGIVEPLKDLYKDEVRRLAVKLGMPSFMAYRQPFPGPGLAIRVMGEITEEKLRVLRKAESIVSEEIANSRGLSESLWQYFAVLTDTKSTGVKGDERAYGYVVAIRSVESREAMTANFSRLPYDVLEAISTRITSEIPEAVRVVYDITNKPPSTIEWE